MKSLCVLFCLLLSGCSYHADSTNHAPADGYATARKHIEQGSGCSIRAMKDAVWSLERHGLSKEYRSRFAEVYKRTCDEYERKTAYRCKTSSPMLIAARAFRNGKTPSRFSSACR